MGVSGGIFWHILCLVKLEKSVEVYVQVAFVRIEILCECLSAATNLSLNNLSKFGEYVADC